MNWAAGRAHFCPLISIFTGKKQYKKRIKIILPYLTSGELQKNRPPLF